MQTKNQNPPRKEWDRLPFENGQRIMDIRSDPVFKAVFTKDTAEARASLSDLISALIGRAVTVETVIANEPAVEDLRQRQLRFDVACKSDKGEPVNVEMAFNPDANEPVRLEYHAARLFVGQDIHGSDRTYNDLKETYQIAILAKKKFFPDGNLTHDFLYYDPKAHIPLGGRTRIITLELEKAEPAAEKQVEEMTGAELWAVFFEYLTDGEKRGKIIEIIKKEKGIAMAVNTLVNITQDEIEYARLCSQIKSQLDYQSGMENARREGRAEGKAEGRAEGKAEGRAEGKAEGRAEGMEKGIQQGMEKGRAEGLEATARNAMAKGLPVDVISDITGLDIETIKQLSVSNSMSTS
jgi:predicted transposase/invertase (TIGR01784 family)